MSLKDELKEYYTVEELSALLRVTHATIEKLEQGGELAGEVFGAITRYPRHEVEKLLGKRRRVKLRRAGIAILGVLAAVISAGVAWQQRKK
jgi:excisionase family DNA binding protein